MVESYHNGISSHVYPGLSVAWVDVGGGCYKVSLGALSYWAKKGKEGKRKEGGSKEEHDQTTIADIDLHACFPC